MSLLSETVSTVQQSQLGVVNTAYNTPFSNLEALQGYSVVCGTVEPRTIGSTYLLINESTGEPVQLPPNSMPYKFFFEPIVPLQGLDPGAGIGPLLFSDETMNTFYDPFGWYAPLEQINPNGCTVTALVFGPKTAVLANYADYPYVGVKVYGGVDLTAGKVKVYLYYTSFPM